MHWHECYSEAEERLGSFPHRHEHHLDQGLSVDQSRLSHPFITDPDLTDFWYMQPPGSITLPKPSWAFTPWFLFSCISCPALFPLMSASEFPDLWSALERTAVMLRWFAKTCSSECLPVFPRSHTVHHFSFSFFFSKQHLFPSPFPHSLLNPRI